MIYVPVEPLESLGTESFPWSFSKNAPAEICYLTGSTGQLTLWSYALIWKDKVISIMKTTETKRARIARHYFVFFHVSSWKPSTLLNPSMKKNWELKSKLLQRPRKLGFVLPKIFSSNLKWWSTEVLLMLMWTLVLKNLTEYAEFAVSWSFPDLI